MKQICVTNPFTTKVKLDGVNIAPNKTESLGLYTAEKAPLVTSLKKRGYIVRLADVVPAEEVCDKQEPSKSVEPVKGVSNNVSNSSKNKVDKKSADNLKNPGDDKANSSDPISNKAKPESKSEPKKPDDNAKKENSSSKEA